MVSAPNHGGILPRTSRTPASGITFRKSAGKEALMATIAHNPTGTVRVVESFIGVMIIDKEHPYAPISYCSSNYDLLGAGNFPRPSARLLQPVDLRCEYRVNPLGVDAAAPRLSWKSQPTVPAARGLGQSAYQILVASSAALLMRNHGDLWDTGKVDGDTSIQVPYAGKPLVSSQGVWWKVCVWDDKARATWSMPASWTMGLLSPDDWKGKWIGLDSGEGRPPELANAQWIGGSNTDAGTITGRPFRRAFGAKTWLEQGLGNAQKVHQILARREPRTESRKGAKARRLTLISRIDANAQTKLPHRGKR